MLLLLLLLARVRRGLERWGRARAGEEALVALLVQAAGRPWIVEHLREQAGGEQASGGVHRDSKNGGGGHEEEEALTASCILAAAWRTSVCVASGHAAFH